MPTPAPSAHDHFFRAVFGQQPIAAEFLARYVPQDIVHPLDLATLTLRSGSFVDDYLKTHHSDLLFEARRRDGGTGLIYVLFEHKSHPERRITVQLLRYVVRVWERDARESAARERAARKRAGNRRPKGEPEPQLVVPIVVYHGVRLWTAPRKLSDLYAGPPGLRRYWPELEYALVDLNAMPEEDIVGEAVMRVALLVLRSIYRKDLGPRLPELLAPLREHPTPLGMLHVIMQYIVQANDRVTEQDVATAFEAVAQDGGGGDMPTLAEQWTERGRVEGRTEGLHQAIADALDERFGAEAHGLADDVRAVTDARTLRAMLRAVWRAATVDEARRVVREA